MQATEIGPRRTRAGLLAAALGLALLCAGGLSTGCDSSRNLSRGISGITNNGTLVVRSEPPGAKVYVNSRYAGRTPQRVKLNQGKHLVVLKLSGYQDSEDWAEVRSGQDKLLEVSLARR